MAEIKFSMHVATHKRPIYVLVSTGLAKQATLGYLELTVLVYIYTVITNICVFKCRWCEELYYEQTTKAPAYKIKVFWISDVHSVL